jgi:hypothetical protein
VVRQGDGYLLPSALLNQSGGFAGFLKDDSDEGSTSNSGFPSDKAVEVTTVVIKGRVAVGVGGLNLEDVPGIGGKVAEAY